MKKNEWGFMDTKAIQQRKKAIANGAMPVLREAGFSYEAKAQLQNMGYEANTSLRELPGKVKYYLDAGAPIHIAKEIAKKVKQFEIQSEINNGHQ